MHTYFLKPRQFAIFILFYFHSTVFYIEWICVFPTQLKQTRIFFQLTVFLSIIIFEFATFSFIIIFGQLWCEVLWHAQARNDNDDEISNDSLQSSSSSSGKRGCCKVGRSHFLLVFVAYVSYRRRGYLCRQNEWVSEWVMVTIEFRSWSSFYSMLTVLLTLCSEVLKKTRNILQ